MTSRVLGAERALSLPADVGHQYADKYALVEAQLSASVVGILSALQVMGLSGATLRTLATWAAAGDSVTLRLMASTKCVFVREAKRTVESPKIVTAPVSGGNGKGVATSIVTEVTDYFWSFSTSWSLDAYRGTGRTPQDIVPISSRTTACCELKSASKAPPYETVSPRSIEVAITFLVKAIDASADNLPARVVIDRASPQCYTPRRNPVAVAALRFGHALHDWSWEVRGFFSTYVEPAANAFALEHHSNATPINSFNASNVVVPALLFEERVPGGAGSSATAPAAARFALISALPVAPDAVALPTAVRSPLVDPLSINSLLAEAHECLLAARTKEPAMPPSTSTALISSEEASLLVACDYVRLVCVHMADGVNYVEDMLRDQLIAAIGKVRFSGGLH